MVSTQAKRPRPADQQIEALEDVERIAREMYHEDLRRPRQGVEIIAASPWRMLDEEERESWRAMVRNLLHKDVIRVGHRPNVERPMEGQLTWKEATLNLKTGEYTERDLDA